MNRTMHGTKRKNSGKNCCPVLQHNTDDAISSSSCFAYRDINKVLEQFDIQPEWKTSGNYDLQVDSNLYL